MERVVHKKGAKSMFWGVLFVAIGLIIVLNVAFGLNIPVVRVLLGLFFVYLGIKFIIGPTFAVSWKTGSFDHQAGRIVMSEGKTAPASLEDLEDEEFSVVFGSGELDLSNTEFASGIHELEVNTVFGESRIYLPQNLKIQPKVKSIMGSVQLPDTAPTEARTDTVLHIEVKSVFGSTKLIRR